MSATASGLTARDRETDLRADEPAIIVSTDSHVGPLIDVQLREYCPKRYLDEFDAYVKAYREAMDSLGGVVGVRPAYGVSMSLDPDVERNRRMILNLKTAGHYDMEARFRDLDRDGVAAEVLYHASLNEEPIPFTTGTGFEPQDAHVQELRAVGLHIYNEWLADACSIQPERSIGLAQLPLWDLEASVAEVEWARQAGLGGLNFPPPRHDLPVFNSDAWEPFWSTCEALEMPLTTHAGGGIDPRTLAGFGGYLLLNVEASGWLSRRGISFMILGGVFSRHPDLRLVLTEQPGDWWLYTIRELDSVYERDSATDEYRKAVRLPSSYFGTNVFIGQSFMSHYEAEIAEAKGLTDCMMWGSDYPHREGTFLYAEDDDEPTVTKLSLKQTFHDLPTDAIVRMTGDNAIRVFGLDRERLRKVADRIGALTPAELATDNDLSDERIAEAIERGRAGSYAFREGDCLHGGG